MSEKSLIKKDLFLYTDDHFHSLKTLLNCFFKEQENYQFYENERTDQIRNTCIIWSEEQKFRLNIYYYPAIKSFYIFLEVGYYYSKGPCLFYSFHFYRNSYVYHHLKEIVCLWTRL